MDAIKKSIGVSHHKEKENNKPPKPEPPKPAKLKVVIESPPVCFIRKPALSTGAIFTGLLKVTVTEPGVVFDTFDLQFLCTEKAKKPVANHCPECSLKTSEMKKWTVLAAPKPLAPGEHDFPFSWHIPGHLPATTHGHLVDLDYHLFAEAKTSKGDIITITEPVLIRRAIQQPESKESNRNFPPTNILGVMTMDNTIYPMQTEIDLQLRIKNVVTHKENAMSRWALRKVIWRIEETEQYVSPACPKHSDKLGGTGKGIQHEHVKCIGDGVMNKGWKSDFSLEDSSIEMEITAGLDAAIKSACDVEATNGLRVKHHVVIECVINEEWAPDHKPKHIASTGAARILKTTFGVVLTDRAGMNISWDEEAPPVYQDVPPSPPLYAEAPEYDLKDLEGELENMGIGSDPSSVAGPSGTAGSSNAP
ncbi:hypothetical protein K402DRAFT_340325 [Aulographum hederae CBS 113979]|uniref:LDB19 N-terminal domain-containing protein n=1 Tax=Aulographum hederae CBS 113979 TaxID=1176131 RepID=A0A6G1GNV7_9PEZI|nr:hypothetical protein K402DRAFT_340325 [Aulographum hederae CBS 113979]